MSNQKDEFIEAEITEQTSLIPATEADTYLPALTLDQAGERYKLFKLFVAEQMVDGKDFGTIPGTEKPTLYKPGAEKLTTFFGLTVKYIDEKVIEDFDKPLFFYRRKCQLWRGDHLIAEASGSCNSMEDRYAWRWVAPHEVPEHLDKSTLEKRVSTEGQWGWAYEKRATTGKYGKPESYWEKFDQAEKAGTLVKSNKTQHWDGKTGVYLEIETVQYRIPNENIFTLVNTFLKMADKRALVAASLIGTNASEFFTQDMEDIVDTAQATAQPVQQEQAQEVKVTKTTKPKAKKKTSGAVQKTTDEMREYVNEWVNKALAEEFPAGEYVKFCETLGYKRESSKILNDNERDFNKAVLHVVGLFEQDSDYVAPESVQQSEIPF